MNSCQFCGTKLTKLEKLSDSWVDKYKCEGCNIRYQVIQSDHMSGNHNLDITTINRPFKEETMENNNEQVKIPEVTVIKRYQNRKLYDTVQSKYVTLEDIGTLVKTGHNVRVIDNKTKSDITRLTLFQVVTKREEKKILDNHEQAMTVNGLETVLRNS